MSTETTSQPAPPAVAPTPAAVVPGAAGVSAAETVAPAPVVTGAVPAAPSASAPTAAAGTPVVTKRSQAEAACPVCGQANTLDSKFCRYCGIGLALVTVPIPAAGAAATTPAAKGAKATGAPVRNGSAPGKPAPAPVSAVSAAALPASTAAPEPATTEPEGEAMDPAEIDARRARQLLDRALMLSDKGDKAGAILACRQAIGLAPGIAAGYAMLGPLLERAGDPRGAMGAYEKVLSIEPSSPIERDSLARLRAAARLAGASRTAGLFHFDAGELFNETSISPAPAPVAPAPAIPAPIAPAAAVPAPVAAVAAAAAVAVPAAAPAPPVAGRETPAPPALSPVPRNNQFTVPPISAAPMAASVAAPVTSPLSFPAIQDDTPVVIPRWVRTLRGERSFWMQSVPLSVLAVVSLGFLLWARNTAASRVEVPNGSLTAPQPTPEVDNEVPRQPVNSQPTATQSNTTAPNPADPNPATDGVRAEPITNGSPPPVPVAPQIAAAPPTERAPRPTGGDRAPAPRATSAPAPEAPTVPPFAMPRPVKVEPATAPEPPVRGVPITPGNSGGSTSGGAPVNPAGAPKTGYVKITTRPASSVPVRPEARSRAAEAAAAEAARNGRTGGAIASASASIEGGRETGWRYQQRALLFLEQGDNNRAADDFRTAIAAYRDQINRGTNTEQARSGISACQDGLRLAQLRLR